MEKSKKDILIIPIERNHSDIELDVKTIDNPVLFSDTFWNHFFSTFPSATIALFNRQHDQYDNIVKVSDSSYDYGLISSRNRIFLINHLPKNLSKEESNNYWKGAGFFVIPDSSDIDDKQEVEVILKKDWRKSSKEVEQEYLRLLSLIADHNNEYAVVAKRSLIDSILAQYQ